MRLLLVGATEVRNSDATLLLASALERAECTVRVLAAMSELPLMAEVGFVAGGTGDRGYQVGFNRHLLATAEEFKPDVVFLYGSNWCVTPGTIRRLRKRHHCQVVLWEVNQHLFSSAAAAAIPLYDHVFALDSYFVPVLRVAGARQVEQLSACADPTEHAPTVLSAEEEKWYRADVAFIGNGSEKRAAALRRLTHTDLRIYGTGWDDAGPELREHVAAEPVYGLKKTKIYSASRLSLNVHQDHMVNGENFRVFEVAACGGVSISAPKPDLLTCLEPGVEVIVFEGEAELAAKVDHYLAHPDERDEIARAGRERVLAEHTYDHRARTLLECLR